MNRKVERMLEQAPNKKHTRVPEDEEQEGISSMRYRN
jgi:hypothetical protein